MKISVKAAAHHLFMGNATAKRHCNIGNGNLLRVGIFCCPTTKFSVETDVAVASYWKTQCRMGRTGLLLTARQQAAEFEGIECYSATRSHYIIQLNG